MQKTANNEMQKIAIIQITELGWHVAMRLKSQLGADIIEREQVGPCWKQYDAFIFVGAMGICVRTIAPYVKDKHEDPAVVCVDTVGHHAIAVLSGHIGGANDLTRRVADNLGIMPTITTQSDNTELWALDTLPAKFHWHCAADPVTLNDAIYYFVSRKPTALLLEVSDEGTAYMERTLPEHVTLIDDINQVDHNLHKLVIIVSPWKRHNARSVIELQFVPQVATLGYGLSRNPDDYDTFLDKIDQLVEKHGFMPGCYKNFATIDVKRDEPFTEALLECEEDVIFYTADELRDVKVPNPSAVVERNVGTPSVCEAAAILGSGHGELAMPKVKSRNFTIALAIDKKYLRASGGHVEIVGAGPGDPELISLRGRKMLERADMILWAGSLVPREVTACHKPGCMVFNSAMMTLKEQCKLMKKHYDKGQFVVRLHTGDPCIFGAIEEQIDFFEKNGMRYHITPGISSFQAAAAELNSQFTVPDLTQTIILTRGEGRTPMPELEKLHLLARSQSTMCIYLSAAIVGSVQAELMAEYPADTPVAVCYHLTWPDQRIFRGTLKDLARIVEDNRLTKTTMIVVGKAIGNREGRSKLYDEMFTHMFRKGKKEEP